jgi:hypothetical protein
VEKAPSSCIQAEPQSDSERSIIFIHRIVDEESVVTTKVIHNKNSNMSVWIQQQQQEATPTTTIALIICWMEHSPN